MKSYELQGREVGVATYPLISDEDRAVISVGMTPIHLVWMVERLTREKLARHGLLKIGCNPDDPTLNAEGKTILQTWAAAIDKEQVQEILRGFTLGLYEAAKANGMMRV